MTGKAAKQRQANKQVTLEGRKLKLYHVCKDGTVSVLRYRAFRDKGKVRRVLVGSLSLSPPKRID